MQHLEFFIGISILFSKFAKQIFLRAEIVASPQTSFIMAHGQEIRNLTRIKSFPYPPPWDVASSSPEDHSIFADTKFLQ